MVQPMTNDMKDFVAKLVTAETVDTLTLGIVRAKLESRYNVEPGSFDAMADDIKIIVTERIQTLDGIENDASDDLYDTQSDDDVVAATCRPARGFTRRAASHLYPKLH